MPARDGCANLILRLRRLIVDTEASPIWIDDELQEVLDQFVTEFYSETLTVVPRQTGPGVVVYTVYRSCNSDLEELTTGDEYAFRLYDSTGVSPSSSLYSVDYIKGVVTFTADQIGKAYYLDGRSFDLNAAAAWCWRENAGTKAGLYNFSEDGQKFDKAVWFDHCMKMVESFEGRARVQTASFVRTDFQGERKRRTGLRTAPSEY